MQACPLDPTNPEGARVTLVPFISIILIRERRARALLLHRLVYVTARRTKIMLRGIRGDCLEEASL